MNNYKKAGIGSGVTKRVLREIVEEGGEGAAKNSIKTILKNLRRDIGEDAFKGWVRGDLRKILSSVPSNLISAFEKSTNKNIMKFFTVADDKALTVLLGENVVKQMDDVVGRSIVGAADVSEKLAVKEAIKSAGGGRKFIRKYMTPGGEADLEILKTLSNPKKMVSQIDSDLKVFFKKNPVIHQRISAKSIGSKLK